MVALARASRVESVPVRRFKKKSQRLRRKNMQLEPGVPLLFQPANHTRLRPCGAGCGVGASRLPGVVRCRLDVVPSFQRD